MPVLTRSETRVLWFTLIYVATAGVAAVVGGNFEFLYYLAVMAALVAAVLALHKRVRLSGGALWGLSLWGAAHMAGGLVPVGDAGVLYNLWLIPGGLKYDQVVHALGFGLTTWVCWQALRSRLSVPYPSFGMAVLCAAAGMGFGALNEVIEFVATLTMAETNVGGYQNTGWDLVANLSGSVGVAGALWWRGRSAPE